MKKTDSILDSMTVFFAQKGAPVTVRRLNKGYSIIHESGQPIARFRPETGNSGLVEVLWWSHRDKWDHIGDFDGLFMGLEEALEYVLSDPIDISWMGQNRGMTGPSGWAAGKRGLLVSLGTLFGSSR